MNSLTSLHCLCGHWELNGYHLYQRYPEIIRSDRFKLFSFVRDPLQVQISLFRAEMLNGVAKASTIEEHLQLRPNYLANRFPANRDNFRQVLDRYFFIGVLESGQASLDLLASLLGRAPRSMPWENKKRSDDQPTGAQDGLSPKVVRRFKRENALDYEIYEYCLDRFERQMSKVHQTLGEGAR